VVAGQILSDHKEAILIRLMTSPLLASLHDKTKVAFLEGRLFTSQSELFKKYSKSFDWLEKSRPSKMPLLF